MKLKPITVILVFALLIRLVSLNQSLWLDEAIQWWAVTTFPLKELITEYIRGDFNPPLFHVLLWFWVKIAGSSEIALRTPSVIFGVLTVYLIYQIASIVFPKKNFSLLTFNFSLPEATALLVATGPLLIYYSQEARMYSLTAFTATATFYWLLKLTQKKTLLRATCYVLSAIAMFYSHYLTWLLVPLFLILNPGLTFLSLVGLIPWAPIFIKQLMQGLATVGGNPIWANVVGGLSLKNVALLPIKFLIGRIAIDNNVVYAAVLVLPLGVVAYLLYKALPSKTENNLKILWAWLILPVVLAALLALKIPVFSYFRFLFVVPALYLIMVYGMSSLRPKIANVIFLAALSFNLIATSVYLFNPRFHREDWRQAARYIESYKEANVPIFIHAAVSPPFAYYHATSSQILSETEVLKAQNYPSIWYIPYAQPIFDPQNSLYQTLLNLGFTEVDKRHFNGVTVIRLKNLNYRYLSSKNLSNSVTQ